jgi:mannose-1-phosphate guanylyltransferase/mannose-6-phosphate isomerase
MAAGIQPVILSGGAGTRLWPASRGSLPKQFLKLTSRRSVLQETALRVADRGRYLPPMVVAAEEHRFLVEEHLRAAGVADAETVLEPAARNTAAAVAAAAALAERRRPGAVMLVLPSDHAIRDRRAFHRAVAKAAEAARAGHLVALGVKPNRPETGFGYIRRGRALGAGTFAVARFVEKPPPKRAAAMVRSGGWLWNAGIFAMMPEAYLGELGKHAPGIASAARRAVERAKRDGRIVRLEARAFAKSPSRSIDKAVMEKTGRGAVVPVAMGWSDLGSWDALWRALPRDRRGNVRRGDAVVLDVEGSFVSADKLPVAAVGLRGAAIVATPDGVLVAARGREAELHGMVAHLEASGRKRPPGLRAEQRPWGGYVSVDSAPGFQVKRITVNPGQALSLQMHRRRAEHWVVVQGVARVTCGERVFDLKAGESAFIPLGAKHRLENPGDGPLALIEVQVGDYLGEDDIVRFADRYGRAEKK